MADIRLECVRVVYRPGDKVVLPGQRHTQPDRAEGTQVALDGADLLVRDGETMAVLGPSGCGKSTLLRVVAGLVSYEGHVYYGDQLVDEVGTGERNLGMVFQDHALYPHFTGHGNLSFSFLVRKRPPEEAMERIRITSDIMGIGFDELLKHRPGVLSGGERQRVAVGRALVRKPDLFLFDEPLSNLDAKLRVRTRGEMKRLLKQFGHTAIYVTHDQTEAIALGDRLAIMRAGRVVQVGTYAALYEQPLDTFVAGFLGSPAMTLLEGKINERGAWQHERLEIPTPDWVKNRLEVGRSLILGIRPENTRLAGNERPTLAGQVAHVERDLPRHAQTLFVEHNGLPDVAVTLPSDEWVGRGDRVSILFPPQHLVFFDGKTGMRMG